METNLLEQLKKATETKLSPDFVIELFKCMFSSQKIFDVCKQHLKYHYLQSTAQKSVLKALYDNFEVTSVIPTIGIIGQMYVGDKDVIALLSQIKKVDIHKDAYESILSQFEQFIKRSLFISLYTRTGELFNQGKQEEAETALAKESTNIVEFQLRDNYYSTVFKDFEKRNEQRKVHTDKVINEKCCFGVHSLDRITRGGISKGTSCLITARSGVGKSLFLRWIAMCNARMGKNVVFFSAEGTERELMATFDSGWSGINLDKIEMGDIPKAKQEKIKAAHRNILATQGEIYTYCSEMFDEMDIQTCRDVIIDIEKTTGKKIDVVCWDYLELFTSKGSYGHNESAERKRREDVITKITAISVEFNHAAAVATQSNDVAPEILKKPDFVLTRHNTAESKGVCRPVSIHLTLNATPDEAEQEIMRIHFDKFRSGKSGSTVRIYQSKANSRFYDSQKTLDTFEEVQNA